MSPNGVIATAVANMAVAGSLRQWGTRRWVPTLSGAPSPLGDPMRGAWIGWYTAAGLGGVAGALLAWRLPTGSAGQVLVLVAWLVFAQAGLLLAVVDLAVRRLPTPVITATGAAAGALIAAAAGLDHRPGLLVGAVAAAVAVGGVYLTLALAAPTQIGMGDVRLAALAGLLLGTRGLGAVVVGAAAAYLLALPFAAWRLRQPERRDLPFGPFLVGGALAGCLLAVG